MNESPNSMFTFTPYLNWMEIFSWQTNVFQIVTSSWDNWYITTSHNVIQKIEISDTLSLHMRISPIQFKERKKKEYHNKTCDVCGPIGACQVFHLDWKVPQTENYPLWNKSRLGRAIVLFLFVWVSSVVCWLSPEPF